MNDFVQRHASSVTGMLSGFDRVRFRGTIRLLANASGLSAVLSYMGILLKDFKDCAMGLSEQLKTASLEMALSSGRPVKYLASPGVCKEDVARQIARRDGIDRGLICVLTAVEPCRSFQIRRDREHKRLVLEPGWRKCLHLYHYFMHPKLGFMHVRVQSWLPFNVHICINGREWLSRQMDRAGIAYRRQENCFTWVQDQAAAQRLLDEQLRMNWTKLLNGILHQAHPAKDTLFANYPLDYYWSAEESEWASDVMFRNRGALSGLYPSLVGHGMRNLSSVDVMRFLGKRVSEQGVVHGNFEGEVVSDLKERPEGMRIKHRVNGNSIKMYDKQGSVLRVETTINNTRDLKVFRRPEGKPKAKPSWQRMRKGVADLRRRAKVSQAAIERYLEAMAAVDKTTSLKQLTEPLCRAVTWKGRRERGLNPLSNEDATLLREVARGEYILNGFRNRDLRELLFKTPADAKEQRRQSGKVTRMIRLLRAHGLIQKVPRTHRYLVSPKGREAITALLCAREANAAKLAKAA